MQRTSVRCVVLHPICKTLYNWRSQGKATGTNEEHPRKKHLTHRLPVRGERPGRRRWARPTSVETPTARATSEAPARAPSFRSRLAEAHQRAAGKHHAGEDRQATQGRNPRAMMRSEPETEPSPEQSMSRPICWGSRRGRSSRKAAGGR
jgi:hypothetical protein